MWQIVLIMMMLIFIGYLLTRERRVRETKDLPSGSGPWQYPGNAYLEIRNTDIHTTSQGCKDVLMSTWREKEFAGWEERMTLLETRAGPNMRLAENFGIENAFTTIDQGYHKEFKTKITKALKTSDQEWQRLWTSSKEIARNHVARQESKANIPFVSLVQSVVFKVVMLKFFPRDSKIDEDAAIANITRLINTIWMNSKRSRKLDSAGGLLSTWKKILMRYLSLDSVTRNLAALKKNLAYVLPGSAGVWEDPRKNPLNIILPTYETLWRVVFHCAIEVLFRHQDRNSLWKACITKLGQTLDNNGEFSISADPERRLCMLDIANEALRLYPPTKRIYRWEQQESPHGTLDEYPELCAADIEAVHRDVQIWGPDALQFDPGRWSRSSADEQKRMMEHFLPFGYGSLSCPARGDFAPKLIGLIVVVLVQELEGRFDCVADLEEDRIDGVEPLKVERNSYDTLKLRRLGDGVL